jgi:CheY-like chemotaxis protein
VQLSPNRIPNLSAVDAGLRTALVVDDVLPLRMVIDGALRLHGVQSIHAANGKQAQHVLLNQVVDVIVTDIEMPRWSGLQLLRWLRQSTPDRLRRIPVIVTSSLTDEATRRRVRMNDNTIFLSKPVVAAELDVLIGMLVTTRWLRRRS